MAAKPPVYLTPKGLQSIKDELRHLTEVKRRELAEYMGSALADGDLRESAAYDEARMLQSANEARIADLEELLHRAVVIEQGEQNGPLKATLGATLVLEAQGERTVFQLVGTHEADVLSGRISDESPLGQALLGRQVGEQVVLQMGGREVTYQVLEVRFD
jgi:transcription elongation factor GreA